MTREDLQGKIWAAGTFVDFDHGLNKAITGCGRLWATRLTHRSSSKPCPSAATGLLRQSNMVAWAAVCHPTH